MRTHIYNEIKYYFLISIMVLASFSVTSFVYSDDNNRYHDDYSSVFAPGYINAAKYQAESIIAQQPPKKSLMENIVEYVQNKMTNKVGQAVSEKAQVAPKLQQKQSSSNKAKRASAKLLVDSTQYNVVIGSGTNAEIDQATGRVIAETFNIDGKDVRHIYAGLYKEGTVGTGEGTAGVSKALSLAGAGDIILVRGGSYDGNITMPNIGVNLYGGYDENGVRNIQSNSSNIEGVVYLYETVEKLPLFIYLFSSEIIYLCYTINDIYRRERNQNHVKSKPI